MILLEGINDIGGGQATSADQLIAAYRQLIARAHADGKCILGGTMTPFEGAGYYSEAKEAIREAANAFIRNSGEFDGVADFDKVTRDPADPTRFLPRTTAAITYTRTTRGIRRWPRRGQPEAARLQALTAH